jgi:DNA-binding beta-propeller fold protein YncE
MGVAVDKDRNIYVADTGNDRIVVFDRNGKYRFEFGGRGIAKPLPGGARTWRPGLLNYPTGIDMGEDGLLYVADFRNDQVCVFRRDGTFVTRFPDPSAPTGRGSSGQDGRGIAVTDVVSRGGTVYATDAYQIFGFSTDGRLKRQFGAPGRGDGQLDHPNGIAIGADGLIIVSDSNHARVQAFTATGQVAWVFGTPPLNASDQSERELGLPRGLCVAEDGSVYVADAFNSQIVRISPEGTLLGTWGDQGTGPGSFFFPNDIETLGAYFVVAEKENNRVQVVELLE